MSVLQLVSRTVEIAFLVIGPDGGQARARRNAHQAMGEAACRRADRLAAEQVLGMPDPHRGLRVAAAAV